MENTSKHQDSPHPVFEDMLVRTSPERQALARAKGDLVWADGNLFVYNYQGKLYVMEPPDDIMEQVIAELEKHPAYTVVEKNVRVEKGECQEEYETAPVDAPLDPAEVLHFIHEMAYCLREVSNFFSCCLLNRPFKMEEHNALREANELISSYQEEYGVDFEADENLKIRLGS